MSIGRRHGPSLAEQGMDVTTTLRAAVALRALILITVLPEENEHLRQNAGSRQQCPALSRPSAHFDREDMMAEHVVLFAGPMGAGKTTAIESLSEIEIVKTEASNTDRKSADKATTTVAFDYGEITVDDVTKIRLYGAPGQKRFDFMWSILMERAKGLLLLINNDATEPIVEMLTYLEQFRELHERGAVVVGISRADVGAGPSIDHFAAALSASLPEVIVPVFTVDARDAEQMKTLLLTLVANVEIRESLNALKGASW